MRRLILLVAALVLTCQAATAQTLIISDFGNLGKVAVEIDAAGNFKFLGIYQQVVTNTIDPTPPPIPQDEPTGPGQLICVRPWSLSLDESDADLTIRESIDAAKSTIPYLRFLPGTADERLQTHPVERYRSLVNDKTRGWVFHVVPTRTTPRIQNQGPLDADAVLRWVGVPKVAWADGQQPNEAQWLDVDFEQQAGDQLGALELPPNLHRDALAAAANVRTLPGFKPIPKSEWPAWVARFPVTRLAKSIRNTTKQTMGSCVGHAAANEIEAGCYHMGGDWLFRRISGMSMYKRIGRSANSGAYIPDAAREIFSRGILPVTGEPYPHTFAQDTGWNVAMPSGWETTGRMWKALVYTTDDEESGFRIGMDCRLGRQIGRSSHSICAGGYTGRTWWYENSWGTGWGDFGKSIGYDSRFYSGYVYQPVLRDEIKVLMARELPEMRALRLDTRNQDASDEFNEKIRAIIEEAERLEALKAEPKTVPRSVPAQPTGRTRLFRKWSCSENSVPCNIA